MYVDNCVASVGSKEDALKFKEESVDIFGTAKMDLREWEIGPLSEEKQVPVLGLFWNLRTDELTCDLRSFAKKMKPGKVTRRKILFWQARHNVRCTPLDWCTFSKCRAAADRIDLPPSRASVAKRYSASVRAPAAVWAVTRRSCHVAGGRSGTTTSGSAGTRLDNTTQSRRPVARYCTPKYAAGHPPASVDQAARLSSAHETLARTKLCLGGATGAA
ncbi:hypothetical protein LAZ67_1006177 [Cordylochernes scorpioides]|uniref:Uncharacterized protein n=1 Tax=Cordylochernes scorpioides TaxID=51811 RepID=A0ABY6JYT4_9ARAC|nr:hypothetical protein LAZ67_1006177 [Cordylochernes scorpioides]